MFEEQRKFHRFLDLAFPAVDALDGLADVALDLAHAFPDVA